MQAKDISCIAYTKVQTSPGYMLPTYMLSSAAQTDMG